MEVELNYLFMVDPQNSQNSPENGGISPPSSIFNDIKKTTSTSSPKTRYSVQKRMVSVPLRDIEGSGLKSDQTNAPPSDSWTWRKYGQKPIKGSPYPRGYYRCSSSKGCPAKKQVERSREDPTMVVVTYSCDHNHTWPTSRTKNHIHNHNSTTSLPSASTTTTSPATIEVVSNISDQIHDPPFSTTQPKPEKHEDFTSDLDMGPGVSFTTTMDQFGWFEDLESTSSIILESPLMVRDIIKNADMTMTFSIRDEDESFFADLGELPECTIDFR